MLRNIVVAKRREAGMLFGFPSENNGAAAQNAAYAFDPNFIVHTAVTGSVSTLDNTWRNLFPTKQHVVRLQPHTTGVVGRTLVQSSLDMLGLTPYGNVFIADGRPVYMSGSIPSNWGYGLTNLSDVTLVLNKTIEIAQARGAKSATPPIIDWQFYIWAQLIDAGQTVRAESYLQNSGIEPDIIQDIQGTTTIAALPLEYRNYLTLMRSLFNLYRTSKVDYINIPLPTIGTSAVFSEMDFALNLLYDTFSREFISVMSAQDTSVGIIGGDDTNIGRADEIMAKYKEKHFRYIKGDLGTLIGVGILSVWATPTGALSSVGQKVKTFKETQSR